PATPGAGRGSRSPHPHEPAGEPVILLQLPTAPAAVLGSRSNSISMVAPTGGSRVTPYRVSLPERVSTIHGHGPPLACRMTWFPFVAIRPDQLDDLARLFVPHPTRVHFAVNVA